MSVFSPKNRYVRRVSATERSWLIAEENSESFANQLILEGSGGWDGPAWRDAVERASAANPGSRLVLKSTFGVLRWIDSGRTPPLRKVDGSRWSGMDLEGAPFLSEPLDPWRGPTCEVLLVHGNPQRMVFRSMHAVMDMRGTMLWAQDMIRALKGEPLVGSDSRLSEFQLARQIKTTLPRKKIRQESDFLSITGARQGVGREVLYRRIRLKGQFSNLLGQTAVLLAQEARRHGSGRVRFTIPVDIRARFPELRSTGNLVPSLYVDVEPGTTPENVSADIRRQLEAAQECYGIQPVLAYPPLWAVRLVFNGMLHRSEKTNRYLWSGVLTNLGRTDPKEYAGGGFEPFGMAAIPPRHPFVPLVLVSFGYNDILDLGLNIPAPLAGDGRMERIVELLRTGLIPKTKVLEDA